MKKKNVTFMVSFTVDLDNPEASEFLLYVRDFIGETLSTKGEGIILENKGQISVKRCNTGRR